jgi:hypothetical protein
VSRRFAQAFKAPLPGPQLLSASGVGGGSIAARRRLERQVASEPCTDPEQALRLKQLASALRRSGVPDSGDRLGKPYRNAFTLPSDDSVVDRAPAILHARAESPLLAYAALAHEEQQQQQPQRRASSVSLVRGRGGGLRLADAAHEDTPSPFSFIGASALPSTAGGSSDGDDGGAPAHSRLGAVHALDPGARLVQLRRKLRTLESEKRGMLSDQKKKSRDRLQ